MTHDAEPKAREIATSRPPTVRVAIDAGPLYGHRSGVGVATEGMIAGLRRRADIVLSPYLISFRADPSGGHRRLPLPGIVASHVWSRSGFPRADRWLGDIDVVHGTNYVVPPSRRPSVVTVYDTWFLEQSDLAAPIVRRAGGNLRRAVGRGAVVHTTSQSTAINVARLLDTDRVRVAYLGPPPRPAAATHDDRAQLITQLDVRDRSIIVAIGTEERRKDLPLLVEAFGCLRRELNVALVIAGAPGDASDEVTEAIARLPADQRRLVHRLGVIDNQTKSALLAIAQVLAYPSLDEGFGFPILEAQMAGVPVVARAVGSIPEVGGDGIALVAERDAEGFAAVLGDAVGDSGVRSRLIEAGLANVTRFSWDTATEQLTDIYRFAMETT